MNMNLTFKVILSIQHFDLIENELCTYCYVEALNYANLIFYGDDNSLFYQVSSKASVSFFSKKELN